MEKNKITLNRFLVNTGFSVADFGYKISYKFNLNVKDSQSRTLIIVVSQIENKIDVVLDKQYSYCDDSSVKELLNSFKQEHLFDRDWLLETIDKLNNERVSD